MKIKRFLMLVLVGLVMVGWWSSEAEAGRRKQSLKVNDKQKMEQAEPKRSRAATRRGDKVYWIEEEETWKFEKGRTPVKVRKQKSNYIPRERRD